MKTMELSNEKCRAHGQRYCSESGCCISLIAAAPVTPVLVSSDFEDSLVGRPTAQSAPTASPSSPVAISAQTPPSTTVSNTPVNDLVRATEAFAASVEAMNAALNLVKELEKRLAFTRE